MTLLTKPVRRVSLATVREQGRPRNIIVILRPPGLIGFRAAGCRREYQLPLDVCYAMAVRAHVACEKRDRIAARKAKRQKGAKTP